MRTCFGIGLFVGSNRWGPHVLDLPAEEFD
jgi:hypothetical protein